MNTEPFLGSKGLRFEPIPPWAIISKTGELIKFDLDECRKLALAWDSGNKSLDNAYAKLLVLVLEGAAQQVDHIQVTGGVSAGTFVRNFSTQDRDIIRV